MALGPKQQGFALLGRLTIIGYLITGTACSQSSPAGEVDHRQSESADAPTLLPGESMGRQWPIGSPCNVEDGWQPVSHDRNDADSGVPLTIPSPDERDRTDLPPGIGFCLGRGGLYPLGYFTMNCARDADCPFDTSCDGSLCRAPCSSDADCIPPTRCDALSGLRICYFRDALWKDMTGNRNTSAIDSARNTDSPNESSR